MDMLLGSGEGGMDRVDGGTYEGGMGGWPLVDLVAVGREGENTHGISDEGKLPALC